MKTVVITGSARGFGLAMIKEFYKHDFNVVLCDISKESLLIAEEEIKKMNYHGKILLFEADITKEDDVNRLINKTLEETETIDVWINNAGVNQPSKPIWELDKKTMDRLIDIDLKGTVLCSKLIMDVMIKQKGGQIFNVEGHGSNDVKILGLSLYGTAKRAITYFTEALAYEAALKETNVLIGKISPGIMITNFIETALGDGEKIELDEKTKNIYNILGDYPETIAKNIVKKIIRNKKNNVKLEWLTKVRAATRFMTARFNKRNFFD